MKTYNNYNKPIQVFERQNRRVYLSQKTVMAEKQNASYDRSRSEQNNVWYAGKKF